MKICTSCKNIKPKNMFYKRESSRDGLHPHCKECVKQKVKNYRNGRHIEYIEIERKVCTKCGINKEKADFPKNKNSIDRLHCHCKECVKNYRNKYYAEAKPLTTNITTKKCTKCGDVKEVDLFHKDKWTLDGYSPQCGECRSANTMRHYKKNKKEVNKKHVQRKALRRKQDYRFRLTHNLRGRIWQAMNNQASNKYNSSIELLGCSVELVRKHLESQFKEGMTWGNYGEWHIDHIRPCASFDLTKLEEQKKCFHYTNLQPLWAKDNLSKADKYDYKLDVDLQTRL